MEKRYLLLRRNIETGPFTLPQLLQQSLAPQDLIRVDSEGEEWRFPSEVNELKGGSDLTPKNNVADTTEGTAVPTIGAGKVFVKMPVQKEEVMDTKQVQSVNTLPESSLEELVTKEDELISRPLSQIKNEYASKSSRLKTKGNYSAYTPYLAALLFITIAGISFFVVRWKPAARVEAATLEKSVPEKQSTQVPEKLTETKGDVLNNEEKEPVVITERTLTPTNKVKQATEKKTENSTAPQKLLVPIAVSKKEPEPKPTPPVQLARLVEVQSTYIRNNDGIGLQVTIENKSDKLLKVAAIDVLFFDQEKNQIKRQTLYFSDVPGGGSATRKSAYHRAASASYQVGLISSEQNGLYVQQ